MSCRRQRDGEYSARTKYPMVLLEYHDYYGVRTSKYSHAAKVKCRSRVNKSKKKKSRGVKKKEREGRGKKKKEEEKEEEAAKQ